MIRIAFSLGSVVTLACVTSLAAAGHRFSQDGRYLGPVPAPLTTPVLFNTPAADAVLSALQIYPPDNAWNERVATLPLHPNSAAIIAQMMTDWGSNRPFSASKYTNYVLVPDNQPRKPLTLDLPEESDLDGGLSPVALYPIPTNLPLCLWPLYSDGETLLNWQLQDVNGQAIMVAPGSGGVWESVATYRVGTTWQAFTGAKFSLLSNTLRPDGWISAAASGCSIFAGVVRYDECVRGMVEHAMNLQVRKIRNTYIYPATHGGNKAETANTPVMGQRLRLRASFAIPANWSVYERAVARGLQKYGAIVADNFGASFSVDVTTDERFPANAFNHLTQILVSDFEVVQSTGPTGGPRSPGAPSVTVGPDQFVTLGQPASLLGAATGTGVSVAWAPVSGPGTVTLGSATASVTTAQFSAPGRYMVRFEADDGVHAVAYDAVVVTVVPAVTVQPLGSSTTVQFSSAVGQQYRIDRRDDLAVGGWTVLANNIAGTGSQVTINDPGTAGIARRVYRVTLLP